MPTADANQRLMPSILDRLIDPESEGTASGHGYSVVQMIDVVRRDLEDLLNTRQSNAGIPEIFVEVHNSLIGYGLPDLIGLKAIGPAQREEIGRIIEGIIARFEPRLRDVHASLIEGADGLERSVRFHIDAKLAVDPAPEVGFETVLELTTGHTTIKPSQA